MTASKTEFLDANILLEIILGRPKQQQAREFIERHDTLYISALTAHLVVHFGQSIVEMPIIHEFLADYTILPLDPMDFEWAFSNARNGDFEDALQIGVAIRNGCDSFITFDKRLAKDYKSLPQISIAFLA